MSAILITKDAIVVHGREALWILFDRFDDTGNPIDISASTIYFEVPEANIRKALVSENFVLEGEPEPEPEGEGEGEGEGEEAPPPPPPPRLAIYLTREEVETLPTTPCDFAVIDETNGAVPDVVWFGKITRTGYVGAQ